MPVMFALISLETLSPIDLYLRRDDAERELEEILCDEPTFAGILEIVVWPTFAQHYDALTNPVSWN